MQCGDVQLINDGPADVSNKARGEQRERKGNAFVNSRASTTTTATAGAALSTLANKRHLVTDLRTGEQRPVVSRSPVLSTAVAAWEGVSLEEHRGGAVESIDFIAPDHVIVVQLTGTARCEFRNGSGPFRTVLLRPGDVVIMPALTPHSVRTPDTGQFVSVRLQPNFVFCAAHQLMDPERVELTTQFHLEDPFIRAAALSLKAEAERAQACGRIYAESLASALAVHVVRHYSIEKKVTRSNSGGLPVYQLRRVVDFISDHLAENISLKQLAEVAGLSPFHFARVFRRATGLAPHQFVVQQRVRRAKELLLQRDRTIADVALAVGFCDQSHLAAHFKRICGVTPMEFFRHSSPARVRSEGQPSEPVPAALAEMDL